MEHSEHGENYEHNDVKRHRECEENDELAENDSNADLKDQNGNHFNFDFDRFGNILYLSHTGEDSKIAPFCKQGN